MKKTEERTMLSIFMANFIRKVKELHNLSDEKEQELHRMAEEDLKKWYGNGRTRIRSNKS